MILTPAAISDVFVIEPRVFRDTRGFLFESFNRRKFQEATGLAPTFVQEVHSKSVKNVLRGLHYQLPPKAQGKLVRVVRGSVFDAVVDLRKDSKSFGQWSGELLSAANQKLLWVPEGFAHGFLVLSRTAEVVYKMTQGYSPEHERQLRWDDPTLNICWPISSAPKLSAKDAAAPFLQEAEIFTSC